MNEPTRSPGAPPDLPLGRHPEGFVYRIELPVASRPRGPHRWARVGPELTWPAASYPVVRSYEELADFPRR